MDKSILIIGAGGMTRAIAYDLRNRAPSCDLTVIDHDPDALTRLVDYLGSEGVTAVQSDASDPDGCRSLFTGKSLVIGAADYRYNFDLTALAVEQGAHWIDLGGNNDVVVKQFDLDAHAKSEGVAIIPDTGLAPGMVNVLAGDAANRLDRVEELHFRVGGLPQKPEPPLFYGLLFSPDGLANEYCEPALVIENGQVRKVPSLTGWERVHVGAPYGELEAFHTSGGSSTMVSTFSGKVTSLDYKTLRYPGHLRRIKLLHDLGFMDDTEVDLGGGNCVVPRRLFGALLERFGWVAEDVVILKSWATGLRNGRKIRIDYKLIDHFDPETGLTSMARTTGFSAAIVARMILDGRISEHGVLRQEVSVPPVEYIRDLELRGIEVEIRENLVSVP